MRIADEAQDKYGRKVSWGVEIRAAGTDRYERIFFTHIAVPVTTRLRQSECQVLDTLVDADVGRNLRQRIDRTAVDEQVAVDAERDGSVAAARVETREPQPWSTTITPGRGTLPIAVGNPISPTGGTPVPDRRRR